MSTETRSITVGGFTVDVVRKDIKNLHLGVYPPHGRVRVAAPLVVSNEAVRLAVIDKLGWIRRQKAKFEEQPRQSEQVARLRHGTSRVLGVATEFCRDTLIGERRVPRFIRPNQREHPVGFNVLDETHRVSLLCRQARSRWVAISRPIPRAPKAIDSATLAAAANAAGMHPSTP